MPISRGKMQWSGKLVLGLVLAAFVAGCTPPVKECEPGVGELSDIQRTLPPCTP